MTRHATDRLLTGFIVVVPAALIAVLAGRPDAAVLAAPWVALLVLGLSRRPVDSPRATVELSASRVVAGDEVDVVTSIAGGAGSVRVTPLPRRGFWPRGDDPARSTPIEDVIVEGRAQVSSSLPAQQWGQHDLGRVRLDVTYPYGLFRESSVTSEPAGLLVHPDPNELHDLLSPRLVRRINGAHGSKDLGRGVEYADIRPYDTGDSLREVNWRASARSGELQVSQRHPDRATDVVLLLDSFVESGHDVKSVVGLAIEAAVALAESHLAVSDRVGLVELGGLVRWVSPGTGRTQLQRLTDALLTTGLSANAAERDLRVIPPRALPPRSFVVALSPLLDDRFIEALFVLSGRGHDVAVIECASNLPTMSAVRGDEPHDVWGLALRLWEAERQIMRHQLADHGIATGRLRRGQHLDLVLKDLARRRRPIARSGYR